MADNPILVVAAYQDLEAAQRGSTPRRPGRRPAGRVPRPDPGLEGRPREHDRPRHRRPPGAAEALAGAAASACWSGCSLPTAGASVAVGATAGAGRREVHRSPGPAGAIGKIGDFTQDRVRDRDVPRRPAPGRRAAATRISRSPWSMDGPGCATSRTVNGRGDGQSLAPTARSCPLLPTKAFGGTVGRTLRDSVPDWSLRPRRPSAEGAPNVLVVLIDDAGFGSIDSFGGPVTTPTFTRVQDLGADLQPGSTSPRSAPPTRAALLTGCTSTAGGPGSIGVPGPRSSATSARKPRSCTAFADPGRTAGSPGLRQVAHDAGQRQGGRGPVRPLAQAWGSTWWEGFLSAPPVSTTRRHR